MNASQHTTHRISDFGEARTVESMEASMTMTSGVGTPFFMAPEMATGTKHYTGAVDVFSFGIMAAQVMVGRLVYDSSDAFETEFGLLFSISLFFSQPNQPLCLFPLSFTCLLLSSKTKHTAFVDAVCQGLRPRVSGCSTKMKALMTACWDANPSSRPCLSFSFPFFIFSPFLSSPLFSLFFPTRIQQHLMPLLTLSVTSSESFKHFPSHQTQPLSSFHSFIITT